MWCVCDEMLCLHHITATLGDLWRFDGVGNDPADPSAANFEGMPFVFMSGDRETDGVPDYCARPPCTSPGIHPGSRYGGTGWAQRDGRLWLLGGRGLANADTNARCSSACGYLADYWSVDARDGSWTWEGGSARDSAGTVYANADGQHEHPGSRMMAAGWTDGRHDMAYLLGGLGHVSHTQGGQMNDLWAFNMTLVSNVLLPSAVSFLVFLSSERVACS